MDIAHRQDTSLVITSFILVILFYETISTEKTLFTLFWHRSGIQMQIVFTKDRNVHELCHCRWH